MPGKLLQIKPLMALFLLFAFCAQAEVSLPESKTWRRAKLVPAGQQVWSFQSSYQRITDRFNGTGQVEPLGKRYSRAITWGELLAAENSLSARAELENYMRARGVRANDVAATSDYELTRDELAFSIDWAYGLTRRWMIGLQMPLFYRRTQVETSVRLTPALAGGAGKPGQISTLALSRGEIRDKVQSLAESELSSSGYDEIPDEQQSLEWGDASLLSQFSLITRPDWAWSIQQVVRFPSSRNPSVSDYFQQTSDDGQVDIGATSLLDYRYRRWIFGWRFGYVAQLPDSAKMRVSSQDSTGVDPKVSRDLGDWMWNAFDFDYRFSRRFGVDLEYAFLAKSEDRYQGSAIEGVNYDSLGEGTDQQIHQTRLGMTYNLDAGSARRGVENKWVASLGYTHPWIGQNSTRAGRASIELISYF